MRAVASTSRASRNSATVAHSDKQSLAAGESGSDEAEPGAAAAIKSLDVM